MNESITLLLHGPSKLVKSLVGIGAINSSFDYSPRTNVLFFI